MQFFLLWLDFIFEDFTELNEGGIQNVSSAYKEQWALISIDEELKLGKRSIRIHEVLLKLIYSCSL